MDARCGITTLVLEKKSLYTRISHKYTFCQILTFKKKANKCVQLTKSKTKTHGKINLLTILLTRSSSYN